MQIKTRQQGTTTIVEIEGRLDTANHAAFEAGINALLASGSPAFVFDCAGLVYVSSAGLRALLSLRKRTHATGIRMRLCRLQPAVAGVFEISGFTGIFELYPSLEQALA